MDWLIPLLTLTAMEIVLGIDNVVFIAILAGRLPKHQQRPARMLGLGLALITRLGLLFTISWILGLTKPIFRLTDLGIPAGWLGDLTNEVSWRDLILVGGGLFLIAKSTIEIHSKLEGAEEELAPRGRGQFGLVLFQIILLDIIFSLDSVITAIGMVRPDRLWVLVVAMIIAVAFMLFFAGMISNFVQRHPTMKMLALSFLILIGVMLVADGLGTHIDRNYIYFAMGFSLVVELLNLRLRAKTAPVQLHGPQPPDGTNAVVQASSLQSPAK